MALQVSPLAPERFPDMAPVAGVRLAAVEAGVRYRNRADVTLAEFVHGTTVAGVLTRSTAPGAPVVWCRKVLPGGMARALVVNAGNANVFTGRAGHEAVAETAAAVAGVIGCRPEQVFVASTGVIGEPLPFRKIVDALPAAKAALSGEAWLAAAKGIATTDTFPKGASRKTSIGGVEVTISGICKGSGMIAPDMATMLGFIFTDAKLPAPIAQGVLAELNETTFNSITVDGDTSTSDTVLLFSTARAQNPVPYGPADPLLKDFKRALHALMLDLAIQVARDGEGAQKLIRIDVSGAASRQAARRIGLSIANSPLVKTAIAC
jgi:glutamate N-acetyltransferase / amino-acid N-acetyltransferase